MLRFNGTNLFRLKLLARTNIKCQNLNLLNLFKWIDLKAANCAKFYTINVIPGSPSGGPNRP
jgi:hypothetical protein